jgi:hypothetical protein
MSTSPVVSDGGFEVVVGSDGALTVPAEELARHGVQPGAHLRLIPRVERKGHKSARGSLAGTVGPGGVAALIDALDDAKAERVTQVTADLS